MKATKKKSRRPAKAPVETPAVGAQWAAPSAETPPALTRRASAEYLGMSEATLRRKEESGELPPSFNAKGHHVHTVEQLRKYKMRERAKQLPSSREFDALAASAAFKLFDAGFGPADAVVQVPVPPVVARDLYRDWADLRNMFVVDGEARQKVEELAGFCNDDEEIKTSADLINALRLVRLESCRCCSSAAPWFCPGCVVEQPGRVNGITQDARDAAEARRAAREGRDTEAAFARRAQSAARAAAERAGAHDDGAAKGRSRHSQAEGPVDPLRKPRK